MIIKCYHAPACADRSEGEGGAGESPRGKSLRVCPLMGFAQKRTLQGNLKLKRCAHTRPPKPSASAKGPYATTPHATIVAAEDKSEPRMFPLENLGRKSTAQ